MRVSAPICAALALLTCSISTLPAQETPGLGTVAFPISCSSAAQHDFNHATALLHHMTYPRARATYQAIVAREPDCAMAHWGVAMTLFQPLWPTRPDLAERRQGWQAVQRALELDPPTERERLFVATVEAFFANPESDDYWTRIRRWEAATLRLHAAHPRDPEASAFRALALLATAPQDRVDRTHADRAAELLLEVYRDNPAHPGAMHYLVHANDMPGREGESLPVVERYDSVAPANPHALHMPTHIFTRLGDWTAVIDGNERAAAAALAHPAGDRGQYVWDEFPHAIEYLVYAQLQRGDDAASATGVTRLQRTAALQPSFKTAFHLASTAARHALERHAWDEAAALGRREVPGLDWDRFAWPDAIITFAAGFGSLHTGDRAAADRALARLKALEGRAADEPIFARNIAMLRLELRAWAAQADGRAAEAVAKMREAEALERSTPKHAVTPAPTLPAAELLGDLFLAQSLPDSALAAYRRSLASYPRRFNSLLGAARSARTAGDAPTAAAYYRDLLAVAAAGATRAGIGEAEEFLAAHR